MEGILEKAVELMYSDEILWNEKGSWNEEVQEKILEEAVDLEDEQEVRVSYVSKDEKYGLVKDTKAKNLGEIRANYFFWKGKDYSPVVQNI